MKKIVMLLFVTAFLGNVSVYADIADVLMKSYQKQCERIDAEAAKKKQVLAVSLAKKLQTQIRLETRKGNLDGALKIRDLIKTLNVSTSSSYKEGVKCDTYIGKWSKMPKYAKLKADKTETRSSIQLTKDERTSRKSYALVFSGYIKIPADGKYIFDLGSDDGSLLFIDDHVVIDNNSAHSMTHKYASLKLTRGYHKIRVEFFNTVSGANLILSVTNPNIKGTPLKELLFHK